MNPTQRLIDAYHKAAAAYEAAKKGVGCRVETFAALSVTERMLMGQFGMANLDLLRLQDRYYR